MGCRYSRSKRQQKFIENCRRKVAHETWSAAQQNLDEVRDAGMLNDPERSAVYLCRLCGKYHWGRSGIIAKLAQKGAFSRLKEQEDQTP